MSFIALVSCEHTLDSTYIPDNENITFSAASGKYSLEGQDLVVKLQRGVLDAQATVKLELKDENGVYTLENETVTFPAGEAYATAVLKYDLADLAPAVDYEFELSFAGADTSKVAAAGVAIFKASALMPLEYEDYGEITFVYSTYAAGYSQYQKDYVCKLQLAKYTNNYYRIVGAHGGPDNLDFKVQDGIAIISSPEPAMQSAVGYPMHPVMTSGTYGNYGNVIIWYDSDYSGSSVQDTEGNKLVEGSVYVSYTLFCVKAGLFYGYWVQNVWEVTKVY